MAVEYSLTSYLRDRAVAFEIIRAVHADSQTTQNKGGHNGQWYTEYS